MHTNSPKGENPAPIFFLRTSDSRLKNNINSKQSTDHSLQITDPNFDTSYSPNREEP